MAENNPSGERCPAPEELALLALPGNHAGGALYEHVARCPSCRAALQQIRETDALVKAHFPPHVSCPDPETLAVYLDGGLEGEEKTAFEEHLASCPSCSFGPELFAGSSVSFPEIADLGEPARETVRSFAQLASPRALSGQPAEVVKVAEVRGRTPVRWQPRVFLAVAGLAAGFLLAIGLFSLLGKKGGEETDFSIDPSLNFTLDSGTAREREVPPSVPKSLSEGETVDGSEPGGTAEVHVPEPPVTPKTPAPKPEAVPPPEGSGAETVEKPPSPPAESPASPESSAPSSSSGPSTVTAVPKQRLFRAEGYGQVYARARESAEWTLVGNRARLPAGWKIKASRVGPGRLLFPGACEILLREETRLTLLESETGLVLRLDSGEMIASRVGEARLSVHLAGAEVKAEPHSVFGVASAGERGILYVLEGEVLLQIGESASRLDAGLKVPFGNGRASRKPTHFDARKTGRWTEILRPRAIELFHENFDSAVRGWSGKVEKRDTFRNSPGALKARSVRDPRLDVAVMKVNHRPLFAYRQNIRLAMACKLTGAKEIEIRLWNPKDQVFHVAKGIPVQSGSWTRFEVSLGDLFGERIPAGKVITGIVIGSPGKGLELLIDDLTIHRIPGPPPVHIEGFGTADLEPQCRFPGRQVCEACRVARILELLRKLEPLETVAEPNGRTRKPGAGESQGEDDGEEAGESEPDAGSGPSAPPSGRPGSPPSGPPNPPPTPGPPPGMPPAPPFPPPPGAGPGPLPPFPGEPRPQGQPTPPQPGGNGGEEGESTPESPAAEEPKPPERKAPSEAAPEDVKQIKRWLRENLPLWWPPHAGWKSRRGEGHPCNCLKTIRKYFQRYRLKADE